MNPSMLKQAQEMKAKLDKIQKELANTVIDVDAGRGAVKVTIDGAQKFQSVKISPKAMNPEKPEALEELVLKAVNEAVSKSQKLAAKQLGRLTGGLRIPGLG